MSEINDPTSSDHLCGTNCTAGLDFDDSTGDEWDQLKMVIVAIAVIVVIAVIAVIVAIYCFKKMAKKAVRANGIDEEDSEYTRYENLKSLQIHQNRLVISVPLLNMTSAAPLSVVLSLLYIYTLN